MPKTLLLADDSVTIQKVVGISFASEDITLVTVDNGDDAIARAKAAKPDLILADVVMPGKNGYEVCEAVKADPELAHIPVLLLTGTFEAFDEERAANAGAAGHVSKPFEAQTLVDQVKRLLTESPKPRPAPKPATEAIPAPIAIDAAAKPASEAPAAEALSFEPIPAPAPGRSVTPPPQPASLEDSFDFFDDEVKELSTPAPASAHDDLDLDSSESAFAFGDDELSPVEPEVDPVPLQPLPSRPAGDRTVAILPDEDAPAASPDSVDRSVGFGMADLAPFGSDLGGRDLDEGDLGGSDLDDSGLDVSEASDSFAPVDAAPSGSADFDFDFESETPIPSGSDIEEPLVPVDAADLAQATVLDPNGASGYDVSSSDLGDPLAIGPSHTPRSEPFSVSSSTSSSDGRSESMGGSGSSELSAPTSPRVRSAQPPSLPDLLDPMDADPMDAENDAHTGLTAEPMDAVPEPIRQPFGVERAALEASATTQPSASPSVTRSDDERPPPIPGFAADPESEGPLIEGERLSELAIPDLEDPEPFAAPRAESPSVSFASSSASTEAAARDAALEEIAPKLRAQLHDTLEKIAWESFSDLTETIVRQAVERVERVAWEVIPQLAETLVREEIRRMKGEGEDS